MQVFISRTLNKSGFCTATGAAQRAMLLSTAESKTLMCNHLALTSVPTDALHSLSVRLSSLQCLWLLLFVLLLMLAVEQHIPSAMDRHLAALRA